ncbi:MAG: hypothetical protein HZA46_17100 [Planctomycetales bacterium]|nr:hypothetical protein [Planctomycetales bacterium]
MKPIVLLTHCLAASSLHAQVLPGTKPLEENPDFSAAMVAGIDRFLDRTRDEMVARRPQFWQRDVSSTQAYSASVAPNRGRLRRIIRAVDELTGPTGSTGARRGIRASAGLRRALDGVRGRDWRRLAASA